MNGSLTLWSAILRSVLPITASDAPAPLTSHGGLGMRSVAIVAFVTALSISNVAHASEGMLPALSLVGGEGTADPSLEITAKPGIRLSHSFRLRIETADRLGSVVRGVSPMRITLVDPHRQRRSASMLDYYPASDSGFHLSAGYRKSPARVRWSPGGASNALQIFAPSTSEPLRVATNIARRSPAMMAGWSGMVGDEASFGLSGGAMQEHGRAMKASSATIAQGIDGGSSSWSRIGAIAQVNFAMKF